MLLPTMRLSVIVTVLRVSVQMPAPADELAVGSVRLPWKRLFAMSTVTPLVTVPQRSRTRRPPPLVPTFAPAIGFATLSMKLEFLTVIDCPE